jgi:hypothetical protein
MQPQLCCKHPKYASSKALGVLRIKGLFTKSIGGEEGPVDAIITPRSPACTKINRRLSEAAA